MEVAHWKAVFRLRELSRCGVRASRSFQPLGGKATCREIRELLPAANGLTFTNNRSCHEHVKSIAVNLGYLDCDRRFYPDKRASGKNTDKEFGDITYFINTFDVYETKRLTRLARADKQRKKRMAKQQRQQAAAAQKAERTAMQEAEDRMATARQKLAPVSTTPTTEPATIDPTPKAIYEDHNTRMEYAIVAATASVISVGAYVLLGQVM